MASLANSAGWMLKPKARIQSLDPLTSVPITMVTMSSASPTAPMRYR